MAAEFEQLTVQVANDGCRADVCVRLSDEREVRFLAVTIDLLRAETATLGWIAQPNLIVVRTLEGANFNDIVSNVLPVWLQYQEPAHRGTAPDEPAKQEYAVECYGAPELSTINGWIDVAIHLANGETYTLTMETPDSIEAGLLEDDGTFFCPDLLVVRRVDRDIIACAIEAVMTVGIHKFGIRSRACLSNDDE